MAGPSKLSIADLDLTVPPQRLFRARHRVRCPECGCSGQYFCRTCRRSLLSQYDPALGINVPPIHLPVHTTIIYSRLESLSKSSIQYLIPLEIDNLKVREIVRDFLEPLPNSVLLMPGPSAKHPAQIEWACVQNVYLLDCKWHQCRKILQSSPELDSIPKVQLSDYASSFWRPSCSRVAGCLSTVECLYFLCREVQR